MKVYRKLVADLLVGDYLQVVSQVPNEDQRPECFRRVEKVEYIEAPQTQGPAKSRNVRIGVQARWCDARCEQPATSNRVQRACDHRPYGRDRFTTCNRYTLDSCATCLNSEHDPTPDPQELAELLERVRAAIQHGPLPVRKTLIDALVQEIRVHSRDHIVPVFRLPNGRHQPDGAVRPGVDWVAPTNPYANHVPLVTGPTIRLAAPPQG